MLGLPRRTVTFGHSYRHPIAALTQSVRVRFALQASSFSASARARMLLPDVSIQEDPSKFRDDAQRKAARKVALDYKPLGAPNKPTSAVILKYQDTPNPRRNEEKELLVSYKGSLNGTRWSIDNHIQVNI